MPYDDDDRPAPRQSAAKSISIAQNIGPLPVWGWGAVVIGAVFLWRRIGGGKAQTAAAATGMTAPAYSPQSGGVYLLPGASPAAPGVPNSTGPTPTPAPADYLPAYPISGPGQAPPGKSCAPGRVLIQGPNGHTCATSQEAVQLGQYLHAITPRAA